MGIMLVYDITNAKSFENISKWLRNIDEVSSLVRVGAKLVLAKRLTKYLFIPDFSSFGGKMWS